MAKPFLELIKMRTYANIKATELPSLQKTIYDVLKNLTVSELDFILANDYATASFTVRTMDRAAHYAICSILKDLTENPRLLVTNDDIRCAWQRFRELTFLKDGLKQGIITEKPAPDGSIAYWCDISPDEPQFKSTEVETVITVLSQKQTTQIWRV